MGGMFALGDVDGPEAVRVVELLDRDYVEKLDDGKPSEPFVLRDWVVGALERKMLQCFGADKQKWQEYLAHPPLPGPTR